MPTKPFFEGMSADGRDTVADFVTSGPASVDRLLGVMSCTDAFGDISDLQTTLASQLSSDGCCGSVNFWYDRYVHWFSHAYCDGHPLSRYSFARSMREGFGLGSRPNGRRAIGTSGKRDVQYRVFCYMGRAQGRRSRARGVVSSGGVSMAESSLITNRGFLAYEARKRELEDFFHFSQGKNVSMCEAVAHIFVDRAARYGLSGTARMWDWCVEHGFGGAGWYRRRLPKGRYILDLSAPAKDLPIPPCDGNDLSDESFIRFSFLLRTPEADHPDVDGWDEQVAEGAVFGRRCLLSVGITLIEPVIDPIDGTRSMREVYIDNPGLLEMSPTGFSFDSDTLLAILGDQSEIRKLMSEMENDTVECEGGLVGHSASTSWLDGEPHTCSAMVFDERVSCYKGAMSPCGNAYGRFGNFTTMSTVATSGYFAAKMDEAMGSDYSGYLIGDEFSGDTGEREPEFAYDTTKPQAVWRRPSRLTSDGHAIPMSDFSR